MNNQQGAPPPSDCKLPEPGQSPEFDRFADLGRKLFALPKSKLEAQLARDESKLKRDGTPKQKPGRKTKGVQE